MFAAIARGERFIGTVATCSKSNGRSDTKRVSTRLIILNDFDITAFEKI